MLYNFYKNKKSSYALGAIIYNLRIHVCMYVRMHNNIITGMVVMLHLFWHLLLLYHHPVQTTACQIELMTC